MEPDYLKSVAQAANVLHDIAFNETICTQVRQAGDIIGTCSKGGATIITTGMGKAGHIARKFSATLSSMGIPSHYIHPGEAAHGDLGQLSHKDVLVMFSTSGKTTEVLAMRDHQQALFPHIRTVAISKDPEALHPLYPVQMPEMTEADDYDLVPTTSTTVMLALSDAIAIRAGKVTLFDNDIFAARHHGGYLGAKARTNALADPKTKMQVAQSLGINYRDLKRDRR